MFQKQDLCSLTTASKCRSLFKMWSNIVSQMFPSCIHEAITASFQLFYQTFQSHRPLNFTILNHSWRCNSFKRCWLWLNLDITCEMMHKTSIMFSLDEMTQPKKPPNILERVGTGQCRTYRYLDWDGFNNLKATNVEPYEGNWNLMS